VSSGKLCFVVAVVVVAAVVVVLCYIHVSYLFLVLTPNDVAEPPTPKSISEGQVFFLEYNRPTCGSRGLNQQ
jgi:hypothetical protein